MSTSSDGRKPIKQVVIEETKRLRQACYQESDDTKGLFPEKVDEADIDQLLTYALAVAETVESEMPELISREHIRARVNSVRELTEDAPRVAGIKGQKCPDRA